MSESDYIERGRTKLNLLLQKLAEKKRNLRKNLQRWRRYNQTTRSRY